MDDRLTPRASALVGTVLSGRWRLDRLLGSGGMAWVYAATHRNGRRVAIKLLNPALSANPRMKQRFLREGYLANRVEHAGVVAVLDDDDTKHGVFLVMELLRGETLEQLRCRHGGSLEPRHVVWAADQLLDILAAAHRAGVVHRDVKPSNIMLTSGGTIKLLDLGIASLRELAEFTTLTETGAALGTPGFMAPEQARGRWDEVDATTDVWAVGATAFRLLTGQRVHEVQTPNEAMIAAATEPAPSLGEVRPELPAELVAVIDRALSPAQAERWPSADAFRDALNRAAQHLPPEQGPPLTAHDEPATVDEAGATGSSQGSFIPSARPTATATPPPTRRRSRLWLGLGLVCVVGASSWTLYRSQQQGADPTELTRASSSARERPATTFARPALPPAKPQPTERQAQPPPSTKAPPRAKPRVAQPVVVRQSKATDEVVAPAPKPASDSSGAKAPERARPPATNLAEKPWASDLFRSRE